MTCDLMSFQTVFQSLSGQWEGDKERLYAMEAHFFIYKIPPPARIESETISSYPIGLGDLHRNKSILAPLFIVESDKNNMVTFSLQILVIGCVSVCCHLSATTVNNGAIYW